jgi:hypothetical protein
MTLRLSTNFEARHELRITPRGVDFNDPCHICSGKFKETKIG